MTTVSIRLSPEISPESLGLANTRPVGAQPWWANRDLELDCPSPDNANLTVVNLNLLPGVHAKIKDGIIDKSKGFVETYVDCPSFPQLKNVRLRAYDGSFYVIADKDGVEIREFAGVDVNHPNAPEKFEKAVRALVEQ